MSRLNLVISLENRNPSVGRIFFPPKDGKGVVGGVMVEAQKKLTVLVPKWVRRPECFTISFACCAGFKPVEAPPGRLKDSKIWL